MTEKETWSPHWAPHVVGTWTPRVVDEDGEVEPAIVEISCAKCGGRHRVECRTGNVRGWINKFAAVHFHADPLAPGNVVDQARAVEASRKRRAAEEAARRASSSTSSDDPTGSSDPGTGDDPSS